MVGKRRGKAKKKGKEERGKKEERKIKRNKGPSQFTITFPMANILPL